jgi:hypothetical protein
LAEVLTQEEINALLSQFSKEEETGQKSRVSEPGKINVVLRRLGHLILPFTESVLHIGQRFSGLELPRFSLGKFLFRLILQASSVIQDRL